MNAADLLLQMATVTTAARTSQDAEKHPTSRKQGEKRKMGEKGSAGKNIGATSAEGAGAGAGAGAGEGGTEGTPASTIQTTSKNKKPRVDPTANRQSSGSGGPKKEQRRALIMRYRAELLELVDKLADKEEKDYGTHFEAFRKKLALFLPLTRSIAGTQLGFAVAAWVALNESCLVIASSYFPRTSSGNWANALMSAILKNLQSDQPISDADRNILAKILSKPTASELVKVFVTTPTESATTKKTNLTILIKILRKLAAKCKEEYTLLLREKVDELRKLREDISIAQAAP
jgi:hypothetical protein